MIKFYDSNSIENMNQFNEDELMYLCSVIESCRCGKAECKYEDHDHSQCEMISKQFNPDRTRDLGDAREWRYYKGLDAHLIYKRLVEHCHTCAVANNPWFPAEFEQDVYYPVNSKEMRSFRL